MKEQNAILRVRNLRKMYERVTAVDNVSFDIHRGEAFGIVGESGSGKSTLARLLVGLLTPDEGTVLFDNRDVSSLGHADLKAVRRRIQIVFQNPYSSLNPRHSVETIIARPLQIHGWGDRSAIHDRVRQVLSLVGLSDRYLHRLPNALSGGERQRVAIARALAPEPTVLVLDEPTSSLDVSVQAQILELLLELRHRLSLTYLFISHDLGLVDYMCDRTLVMYAGTVVELGPSSTIHRHPYHPYTKMLISSILVPCIREADEPSVPTTWDPPPGWGSTSTTLVEVEQGHFVRKDHKYDN